MPSDPHLQQQVPMRSIQNYVLDSAQQRRLGMTATCPTSTSGLNSLHLSLTKILSQGGNPESQPYVINTGGSAPHYNLNYCPCLTRARAGKGAFFLSWLMRSMNVYEEVMLQGVRPHEVASTSVSYSQLGNMAGNAIQVDLLALVLRGLLRSVGLM